MSAALLQPNQFAPTETSLRTQTMVWAEAKLCIITTTTCHAALVMQPSPELT
jgi:hypothetical protein